jgi:drug/metabolite transporter (DMT)-like permease
MLLMALAPAMAAILAWIFLGEVLSQGQMVGIGLTLVGIAWVVFDGNQKNQTTIADRKQYILGILFGLGGAVGQALGVVTAKPGLAGDFPAISGNFIRILTAFVILWLYTLIRRQAHGTVQTLTEKPDALPYILAGTIAGPTIAVSLNLFAIQNAEVGVASTLTSITPIILLPVGYFIFKERFGWGAVIGTIIAITGVALLFLV